MSFSVKHLAILAFAVTILSASGCKKEPFSVRSGHVVWSGEFIDGGCGWLIAFPPDIQYQPRNMPDSYLVDSLPVRVTYRDLKNRPDCLNRSDVDGQIYIHKIENAL